jgi:phosphoribosylanthranilate isomerase
MIIKVCGMRDPENVRQLLSLKVDWMGCILYPPSPRSIRPEAVPNLPGKLPKIGVVVNEPLEQVQLWAQSLQLAGVQLHGKESAGYCQRLKEALPDLTILKAIPIREASDLQIAMDYDGQVDRLLFDTKGPQAGGNGVTFDWRILQDYRGTTPFWLSGGIGPESVRDLHQFSHPQWTGIDLNSRFEFTPGQKNIQALADFIEKFRNHDHKN